MFEMVCGTAVLLIFFGIIGVGYHKHMKAIYDDIADRLGFHQKW